MPYRITIRPGITIPDEVRVKLKYSEQFILTETTGTANSYIFRGNGPFDPDLTGTGSQPSGYDQWSSFFLSQRTLGCRIKVRMISLAATLTYFRYCVGPIPGTVTYNNSSGIDNMAVGKYVQTREVITNTKPQVVDMEFSTAKIYGKSLNAVEEEDDFSSVIGGIPNNQWTWQIMLDALDLTNTASITVIVELWYDVVFYQKVLLGLS